MRVDVSLEGAWEGGSATGGVNMKELEDPFTEATAFLDRYKSAKIVVIVDTHCLEGGFFVYTGSSPADYLACGLEEVQSISSFSTMFSITKMLYRLSGIVSQQVLLNTCPPQQALKTTNTKALF
jgi:hypothetical protein